MNLQTSVSIPRSVRPITYDDRLLLLGSCFADSMAEPFRQHYFRVTSNPFGTLYNPLSIAQALHLQQVPTLVEWGGLYHSMAHHGSFSCPTEEAAHAACAESIERMQQTLRDATVIIVTFGTAWVYEMDGQVVANCHKMPASRFTRRCLTVDEIVAAWQPILQQYPDKQFIFTVSPIRHLRDGLHANQLSKSILLQAVDILTTHYFPSYEIMLDELRDYRFYADDLVHPSSLAVQYIWERFVECYMSDVTRAEMQTLHRLWLDRHHTLLHPDSPDSVRFIAHVEQSLQSLRQRYPWL